MRRASACSSKSIKCFATARSCRFYFWAPPFAAIADILPQRFAKGRLLVIVHTQQNDTSLNALNIAIQIAPKF